MSERRFTRAKMAEKILDIDGEQIDQWTLLRALARIQNGCMEIGHQWGEDGDSEVWTATREHGSPNDREWDTVATAPSLVSLLWKIGDANAR